MTASNTLLISKLETVSSFSCWTRGVFNKTIRQLPTIAKQLEQNNVVEIKEKALCFVADVYVVNTIIVIAATILVFVFLNRISIDHLKRVEKCSLDIGEIKATIEYEKIIGLCFSLLLFVVILTEPSFNETSVVLKYANSIASNPWDSLRVSVLFSVFYLCLALLIVSKRTESLLASRSENV